MPTYLYNKVQDGIEIRFDKKPANYILDYLKQEGWRWNRDKQCWYAKRSESNRRFADELCEGRYDEFLGYTPIDFECREKENARKKVLLEVRCKILYGWKWEYENFDIDRLKQLPDDIEHSRLYTACVGDFPRFHNIKLKECTLEELRILKWEVEKYKYALQTITKMVEERNLRLYEDVYLQQKELYEQRMLKNVVDRAYAEMKRRERQKLSVKPGERLCNKCYSIYNSALKFCPSCDRLDGLKRILHKLELKQSTFWQNYFLLDGNLTPIGVARNFRYSTAEELPEGVEDFASNMVNPDIEEITKRIIKKMKLPRINYNMDRDEFVDAMAILSFSNKNDVEFHCNQFCLYHSDNPLEKV